VAFEYLLDEGDHLWRRRVDEVPAADECGAGVRECVREGFDRLVELGR
jgi:hypothetical protein